MLTIGYVTKITTSYKSLDQIKQKYESFGGIIEMRRRRRSSVARADCRAIGPNGNASYGCLVKDNQRKALKAPVFLRNYIRSSKARPRY